MTRSRVARRTGDRTAAAVITLALVLGAAASVPCLARPGDAASNAVEDPLTLEQVVRSIVSGVPEDEVLAAIASRPVGYELDDEMVRELTTAGISDRVIAALRARTRPPNPEGAVPDDRVDTVAEKVSLFELRVAGDERTDDAPPVGLEVPARLPAALASELGLDPGGADAIVESVGLYAACVSPTHVPDHWRSKSPLGRDFLSMARHRMLAFSEMPVEIFDDGRRARAVRSDATLTARAPSRAQGEETTVPRVHDVRVGIALKPRGGRYLRLADVAIDGAEASDPPRVLELRLDVGRPSGARLSIVEKERPRECP